MKELIVCCLWSIALPITVNAEEPHEVIVIAHRGASGYLPEHTLAAKALAHGMGADYLEQDVVLTKDDVPIVMHDIHLDQVTDVRAKFPDRHREDGRFYAIDFTLEEIKQLDVFERFNHETGNPVYQERFPGHSGLFKVPTLEEELLFIQGLNKSTGKNVGIYPELKAPTFHHQHGKDLAAIVLKVLFERGYDKSTDKVYLQCFDETETRRLKSEFKTPFKVIQLLGNEKWMHADREELESQLSEISTYADGVGPSISSIFTTNEASEVVATPFLQFAHQAGLDVHPYTLRMDAIAKPFKDFVSMHALAFEHGVDGVFTDFPDATIQLLKNQSQ